MDRHWVRVGVAIAAVALLCDTAVAQGKPSGAASLKEIRQELEQLREQRQQDRQRIEELEQKLKAMEESTSQQEANQKRLVDRILPEMRSLLPGTDRFMLSGYGFATYHWNDNENSNSFSAGFNPIFLFRPTDWILFESELEVKLPEDAETEVNLEYGQADIFLTDYATLVAGKSLLPFGEFIERLHPAWVNKLVSHPLPFREADEGGVLPFSDIGAQLRGGVPLAYGLGTRVEYTVYVANGPRYESDEVGAPFTSNNVDINHGKAFGARLGLEPLPIDQNFGRLHLGVSTYDGTWDDGGDLWLTSWGLDAAYQLGPAELRGEYVFTRRSMPQDVGDDKREGWYVQGAYKLAEVGVPYIERTELVVRYSGQNQLQAPEGFLPHPRQVALGIDYWFTPSVVWKLEYDRDLPRDAPDNNEIRTQIAVGF
jgi:DNA-binding transcriptional MerR regulator